MNNETNDKNSEIPINLLESVNKVKSIVTETDKKTLINNVPLTDQFLKTNIINKESRLNWDTYFMSIAILASKRSTCSRLNVGCILVDNNRIVTTGYNGFLKGSPHKSKVIDGHEQLTIHAEQNAICDAAHRGVSINNTTAYVTHMPCINCCKLLIASGIKEIKYLEDYKNNDLVLQLAMENSIRLIKL